MLYIEQKYANRLSYKLSHFKLKRTQPYLANFRCVFCGDSERNQYKARAYIGASKDKLFFYCHNCNVSLSFSQFLYHIDPILYKEMRMETFREKKPHSMETFQTSKIEFFVNPNWQVGMTCLFDLPATHFACDYILNERMVPAKYLNQFFFCDNFYHWVNTLIPDKFGEEALSHDHSRLVLPLFDKNKEAFGFCARAFSGDTKQRYITIMLPNTEQPKVFGLDRLVESETDSVLIFEGPIDSLFVENSLAMLGTYADPTQFLIDPTKAIFVYDNEPRNKEVLRHMKDRIDEGYRIVIWPADFDQKDVNAAIQKGSLRPESVESFLFSHVYKGATAHLALARWRKA